MAYIKHLFATLLLVVLYASVPALGQDQNVAAPYTIKVVKAANQPAPGMQSFSFAEQNGEWLLIGGRRNGFHRTTLPESTFPTRTANDSIFVVDPANNRMWQAALPERYRFILGSTNAQSYQDGPTLYIIGGYGSTCVADSASCYQTFPNLTAINLPLMIAGVKAGNLIGIERSIMTITDERMRVTGGELKKMGGYFYLVFGQNYDNIYKGAYVGKYTEEIRRFNIDNDGQALSISNYIAYQDPTGATGTASQYHRRDLNVVDAIRPGGAYGLTVYGGVFTENAGGWVHPITIDQSGDQASITVDTTFSQKVSQYECAHVLMYDPRTLAMYTTLLGGVSYYYYDKNGKLVPSTLDNWLPFSSAITTLINRNWRTVEYVQPAAQSLPERLGANAIFIPLSNLARFRGSNDVLDYSKLPAGNSVLLGHMYGGIFATADQSSEFNPTYASSTIYEVWLDR